MQFIIENHKIYAQNEAGERLAEVDFPALDENTVSIDHTFVDPSLRGQGVAATLMKMTIEELRRSGRKAVPVCSFAQKWFDAHPEQADLLVNQSLSDKPELL